MPIISSFTGVAARGFGFTNGLPPLPPTDISFATSELNAVVTFTTTPTSYPVDIVQAKIMQGATLISDWATVTSGGNISASNLTPALLYTVYFRTRDTGGQISQEVSQTFTTIAETAPGAPTFSLAVASGDAGTFKFNITSTGGTAGTYSRITQYRIETSAGAQLLDWTTISSNSGTVTAYGADTYNGAGALSPATTYRVRLKTVADTSGTITYSSPAYQEVTTNGIVAPNAPTSLSAAPVAGTPGEFSFEFSHTPGLARSYPVYGSQYRIRTNNSGTITYLSGYSTYQQFTGTVTIGTSSYVGAILTPGSTYYIDTRTYDTLGTFSTVTSTSVTLTAERAPGAPTRSLAVASGDAGTFKFNITSTGGTAGSYPRTTQYRVEDSAGAQLKDWTTISSNSGTVTAYGADTYNGAGALSPATTYRVRLKTVADTSGTITYSSPAYQEVTTNGIVAPNAPTSLTAAVVATGNEGEFSFTFSHTAGTARSYPVLSSQYRVRSNNSGTITYVTGYDTYQDFVGTKAIGTSSYVGAILTPGSTYYIDTRTKDTQGTLSAVTSTSVTLTAKRNPTVSSLTVAAPTYNGTNTTTLNVTFDGASGSWPISSYQYSTNAGTNWKTFSGSAPYSFSVLSSSTASLVADTSYTVYVRAVDTQENVSGSGSGVAATTNAPVPSAPTLTWNPNMTSSSVDNAYLLLSQPSYGAVAYVEVSTNSNLSGATTYNSSTHPTIVTYDNGLSRWLVSIGSQAFNSTYYYRAYVRNKHGATGESGYSGTRTWVTVKKEIDWSISDATEVLVGDSEDPPTGSCANANYRIGIVMSGVSQYDYQVGYKRVTKISAQLACGATCNLRPTGYTTAWKIPSGTEYTTGLSGTLDAPFETREVTGLNITGLAVNGTFYLRTPSSWPKTSSGTFGCLPYNGDYIKGKNFTLTGKETQAGSVT